MLLLHRPLPAATVTPTPTVTPTSTVTPTPTPQPIKHNYYVTVIIHCAGTMCNNGYGEYWTLQPYYANNPRVTVALAYGFNAAVYNATLEPGAINGDWVRGMVQETGQTVYFTWGAGYYTQVETRVDAQLAM